MSKEFNTLEPEQQCAFELAIKPKKPTTVIAGYAGTGKTTVLAAVANELGREGCYVMCPTNKAAIVLRNKGIRQAQTIHSVLYSPQEVHIYKKDDEGNIIYRDNPDGSPMRNEYGERVPIIIDKKIEFVLLEREEKIPVPALVDESSMVNDGLRKDLETVFDNIIYFGDPAQLPPVYGKGIFDEYEPDIFLKEVHRQALNSPIIRYATSIRNGEELNIYKIVDKEHLFTTHSGNKKIIPTLVEKNVQAICWTNKMRRKINQEIRKAKGHTFGDLCNGEEIISLRNVRVPQMLPDGRQTKVIKFYNGQFLKVTQGSKDTKNPFNSSMIGMVDPSTGKEYNHTLWPFWNPEYFNLKDNKAKWEEKLDIARHSHKKTIIFGADFDFAYCLTAHKAQGSEFENVAVWDQRGLMRNDADKWMYTAITRAKEKLLIIK